MPRRASSKLNPIHLIGATLVLIVAFVGGKLLMKGGSKTDISGTSLQIDAAVENANSLRGNEYVVEGKIDDQIRWVSGVGQVISLKVMDGNETKFIGIEIPAELSDINLEREQDYIFRIRFRESGIAIAEEIARR